MITTRSQSLAMSTPQTSSAPPESPESIPSKESPISPGWIHAITILMGHSPWTKDPEMDPIPRSHQLHQPCDLMGSHTV